MTRTISFLIVLLILGGGVSAQAHGVRVFAYEEDHQIIAEARFSGNKPAIGAEVEVVAVGTTSVLLSGKTDHDGIFRFPLPATDSQELDIIVNAGSGHQARWRHRIHELPTAEPVVLASAPAPSPGLEEKASIPPELLEAALQHALAQELAPLRRELARNSAKDPGLEAILGGLGYIAGLMGLAYYLRAKKLLQTAE